MNVRPSLLALFGTCALLAGLPAAAKLPPPTPEVKAKADEEKAKKDWSDKVAAFKLCQSQDRIAAKYRETAGGNAKPAVQTPACTDPGPFTAAAGTPPLEAAGAHSPARTAAQPPNEKATDAEQRGGVKK
jgi:hypothetical protein